MLILASAAKLIELVQHTSASSGSGDQPSWSATLPGASIGNLLTATMAWYSGAMPTIAIASNNGTIMSPAIGAAAWSDNPGSAIGYGINAASGDVTITVNFSGVMVGYPTLQLQEWRGLAASGNDQGIGNSTAPINVSSIVVSTNGGLTRDSSLILSTQAPAALAVTGVGPDQIPLEGIVSSYQLTNSSLGTVITHTYTWDGGGSQDISCAIAAFL